MNVFTIAKSLSEHNSWSQRTLAIQQCAYDLVACTNCNDDAGHHGSFVINALVEINSKEAATGKKQANRCMSTLIAANDDQRIEETHQRGGRGEYAYTSDQVEVRTIPQRGSDERRLSSMRVATTSFVGVAQSSTLVSKSFVGVTGYTLFGILSDTKNLEPNHELETYRHMLHGSNSAHTHKKYVRMKADIGNAIARPGFASDGRETCSNKRCETSSEADQRSVCSPRKFDSVNKDWLSGSNTTHDNDIEASNITGDILDRKGSQTVSIRAEESSVSLGATRRAMCVTNGTYE